MKLYGSYISDSFVKDIVEYIFVDGNNVINSWNDIFRLERESLEDCREKLFALLSNYQGYKKKNIIVVFDAHLVKGSLEKKEIYDDLTIIFTKENETADNYIEKFVCNLANSNGITVVTSDYLEQTTVLNYGGLECQPGNSRGK